MGRAVSATLAKRAQAGWKLLVDDPTLHPADVLAAVVWPSDVRLEERCECGRRLFKRGLCWAHYWSQRDDERRAA